MQHQARCDDHALDPGAAKKSVKKRSRFEPTSPKTFVYIQLSLNHLVVGIAFTKSLRYPTYLHAHFTPIFKELGSCTNHCSRSLESSKRVISLLTLTLYHNHIISQVFC